MKKQPIFKDEPINSERMVDFSKTQAESYRQHAYDKDGAIARMEKLLGFADTLPGPDDTYLPSDKNQNLNDPELKEMIKTYQLRNYGYYFTGKTNSDGSKEVVDAKGKHQAIFTGNIEMTL